MLGQTSVDRLLDENGRPYFLWDCDMTLDEFRRGLDNPDPSRRAYLLGKLMRQAKPEDVFQFTNLETVRSTWPLVEKHLGNRREFWCWLLDAWDAPADDNQ